MVSDLQFDRIFHSLQVKEMCERSNGLFFTENEINDM